MGKPLRLLNLTLGLVAVLIVGALVKTWVAPAASTPSPAVAKPSQELVTVAFNRPARPSLAQFDVLLEKNPFKQPPPVPVGARPSAPPTPPRPLPTLSGTILVGDEWRAIVSDKGKGDIYVVGQEVGGGVITAIKEDRIVLKRGDSTVEVPLKAVIEAVPSSAPRQAQPPAQPASIPPPPPTVGVPAGAGEKHAPSDQYEKERLKEEKKAEKERRKALRENR
ncbi:MAG: hypothetical protein ACREJ6_15445 [Candidatus Methylomirabilis sp.]